MKVRIQRNQIHHFKEEDIDPLRPHIVAYKDVLQLGVQFPSDCPWAEVPSIAT